jgi:predicted nucleotidyltransferase component of viral defense system
MEITKEVLKEIIRKTDSKNNVFLRNVLKEYLHVLILDFIYSHKKYSDLVFYGGSCLSHCHGLNRLSEDLDFLDSDKKIDVSELGRNLEEYFKKNTDIRVKTTIQKFRIYLKFSLLHELGIAKKNDSDLLFVKIEIFKGFNFCKNYKTEITPLFKFNKTILIKNFDISTLMATKVRAILYRKWEKTNKKGETIAKVKGRDYFDLMWYLEKGIIPNFKCIEGIKNKEDFKEKMLKAVEKIDTRSVQIDIEPLIEDFALVKKLSKNLKDILKRLIKKV